MVLYGSGGSVSDSNLNGITLEMEACTGANGGVQKCSNALVGQQTVAGLAGRKSMSALWMTHSGAMPPAEQCKKVAALQREYPWVTEGTDFFDGSHVICSNGTHYY